MPGKRRLKSSKRPQDFTDIGPDTAGKGPCAKGFGGGCKEARIKEAIGGNQVFIAQIIAFLTHPGQPEGDGVDDIVSG